MFEKTDIGKNITSHLHLYIYNLHYEKLGNNKTVCIEDQVPFNIPDSWEWIRLSSVNELYTGNSINESEKKRNFTGLSDGRFYIGTKDISFDHTINYDNGIRVPHMFNKFRVAPKNSVLMCVEGGSAGRKIAFTNQDVCFGNKLCCFVSLGVDYRFLYYYLQSSVFQDAFRKNTTGIIGGVSVNVLKSMLLPVAPIEEQLRIAESADLILSLVEQIETHKNDLMSQIDKAKSKILDLAIRGKLVPQDPSDEPASMLLERIRAEKEKLIKQGKIKRDKKESNIIKGEDNSYYCIVDGKQILVSKFVGYELPINWEWIELKDIASISSGKTPKIEQITQYGSIPYYKVSDMNKIGNEVYMTVNENYINKNYNGTIFDAGSLIFPKNGGAVLTNKKRILRMDSAVDLNIGVITSSKYMENPYVFYMFCSVDIGKLHKGSTIPTVDINMIDSLIFALPPIAEQIRIVEAIRKFFAYLDNIVLTLV